jgi:hypothetical protein
MKAVIYPFGKREPIVQLTQDFPQLQWALVASTEDVARKIGDASILITSNRVCNPAYGEVVRRKAMRCAGSISTPPASSRGSPWDCRRRPP